MDNLIILVGVGIAGLVILYLFINGKRNSDPLNRKCAAELCEYFMTEGALDVDEVRRIFKTNARYKSQANHVLSMVPPLLMNAGYPKEVALTVVPLLRAAVYEIPN